MVTVVIYGNGVGTALGGAGVAVLVIEGGFSSLSLLETTWCFFPVPFEDEDNGN